MAKEKTKVLELAGWVGKYADPWEALSGVDPMSPQDTWIGAFDSPLRNKNLNLVVGIWSRSEQVTLWNYSPVGRECQGTEKSEKKKTIVSDIRWTVSEVVGYGSGNDGALSLAARGGED